MKKHGIGIIGVDEAGRGSLAGPVFAAAVFLNKKNEKEIFKCGLALRDSKQLTPKQREEWFEFMKELAEKNKDFIFSYSAVSASVIDKINVARAADRAAERSCLKILKIRRVPNKIFLDAGLNFKNPVFQKFKISSMPKADENIPAVALASIVAKVKRDKFIVKKGNEYPEYGFADHKGYGTAAHLKALQKFGASDFHRKTFGVGWWN